LFKKETGILLTPVQAQQKALSLIRYLAISVTPLENKSKDDKMELPDLDKEHKIFVPNGGQR